MTTRIKWLAVWVCLFTSAALGADLETDWITPVEGQEEAALGARMESIEESAEEGTKVTISIPKASLNTADNLEEIVVYGKREDTTEPELDIPHEWVSDYDNDRYGLILYLGKQGRIPLRLYLKGQDAP